MLGNDTSPPQQWTAAANKKNALVLCVKDIHSRLQNAILEHRLPSGTKLGEDKLAEIFGVSRARIRQALTQLAHEQLVEIFPQRGAFVASPSPQQARDIFDARRVVEPAIVARLITSLTDAKLEQLKQHINKETAARMTGEQRAIVRLSGEFHVLLAVLAGNAVLARTMRDLSAVTCLIISLYNVPTVHSCRADEHERLISAIALGDIQRAQDLVLEHLSHIERSLSFSADAKGVDLQSILGACC